MTLSLFITIVFVFVLIFEFWLGIAVTGINEGEMYVERDKEPAKYWFAMTLHSAVTIGLPILNVLSR